MNIPPWLFAAACVASFVAGVLVSACLFFVLARMMDGYVAMQSKSDKDHEPPSKTEPGQLDFFGREGKEE